MRTLTGLSCSQTGRTGASGKEACIGKGGLSGLVLRGFRTAFLSAGLRLALDGFAATGALFAVGAGVGSGVASALAVEALRGLVDLTAGATSSPFRGSGAFGVSGALVFLALDFLWATLEPSVTWTACGLSLRINVDFFMVYQGLFSVQRAVWVNRISAGQGSQPDWRGVPNPWPVWMGEGRSPRL